MEQQKPATTGYEPKYIKHKKASNMLANKKMQISNNNSNPNQVQVQNNPNSVHSPHQLQSEQLLSQNTLPAGWEYAQDHEGRTFYIDHNNQTTTWQHPLSQILGETTKSPPSTSQQHQVFTPAVRTQKPTHLVMPNLTIQNSNSLQNSLTSASSYYSPSNSYPNSNPLNNNNSSSNNVGNNTNSSPLYHQIPPQFNNSPTRRNNSNMSLPTPSSTSSSSTSDIVKAEIAQIRQRVEILEHERLLEKELQDTKKELEEVSEAMKSLENMYFNVCAMNEI